MSDSIITCNSTMVSNSTNGAVPSSSNLSGTAVVMRGNESFADSDVNPADYYYPSAPLPSDASDSSVELLTPSRRDQNRFSNSKVSNTATGSSATIVCKYSRRMMSKARQNGDKKMQPPFEEVVTGDFILYTEENLAVSLSHRQQQKQIVPHNRRQLRKQSKRVKVANTRPQHKEEPGVSFQFYGRSGNVVPAPPISTLMLSNRSMSISNCSTNDSFMVSRSSISSMGMSQQYSDRVSLENNFGSLNPQSNLSTAGRLIENGYAPSIKEDDEAQALQKAYRLASDTVCFDARVILAVTVIVYCFVRVVGDR
ncbi:unnamed protein product [Peronospora belbahrii]|uniref:Uncharacterized protein n=1 Tax=Peronospora belbahrii TaxID=622444 RepID=A0AAU9L2U2_9STRA|nr:unnamed protein product [Peronospora belbahrii]